MYFHRLVVRQQVASQKRHVAQACDLWNDRPRSGGDENFFAGQPFAINLHRVLIDKLNVAFFDCELSAGQALVFLFSIAVADVILLSDQFAKIDVDLRRRQPGITRMPCIVNDLRRFNQILRRQTSAIHAGPADGAFLCHHRCFAKLLRAQRRSERGRARAKNHQIKLCGIRHFQCVLKSQPSFGTGFSPFSIASSSLIAAFKTFICSASR